MRAMKTQVRLKTVRILSKFFLSSALCEHDYDLCWSQIRRGNCVTLRDEFLEELRGGMSLGEIRRKIRRQSQLYGEIREFLREARKNVEERRVSLK